MIRRTPLSLLTVSAGQDYAANISYAAHFAYSLAEWVASSNRSEKVVGTGRHYSCAISPLPHYSCDRYSTCWSILDLPEIQNKGKPWYELQTGGSRAEKAMLLPHSSILVE